MEEALLCCQKRTYQLFKDSNVPLLDGFGESTQLKAKVKYNSEYNIPDLSLPAAQPRHSQGLLLTNGEPERKESVPLMITAGGAGAGEPASANKTATALITVQTGNSTGVPGGQGYQQSTAVVARRQPPKVPKPTWHAPWEMLSVLSGHLGWVRSIAFDPSNEWFATGSADRTIKIWNLAKCCAGIEGGLLLTLTGHINAIRGLAVSPRHPYLFSASEDKKVLCWDLEQNKVIRSYHGHLSGVMCLAIHPTLDLLITAGRDSVARVWDIRTKLQVHTLAGHDDAIFSILTNPVDPQVITGSQDKTVRLWDLAAGRTMTTLTHHKKGIRSLVAHPRELTFASGAADNIKKWQTRDGVFLQNFTGHNAIVNCMSMNEDNVLVSCADNGSMCFWDYGTGHCFQKTQTIVQPGSLDAEAGVYACAFDLTGSRLVTCEADKSIKIWKENESASEESHPIDMKAWTKQCLSLKRH